MSKEIEELKGEIRAALQGFSEPEISLLIGIGVRVDSPSQAVKRVSPIVHLSPKEEEVVRKVAKLKKMVRDVDPKADFSKVLQNLRKPKESKMDKAKERVEGLKARLKLNIHGKQEEKIKKFTDSVIKEFESDLDDDFARKDGIVRNFITTSLNEAEFTEALDRLKKMGLTVVGWDRYPLKVTVALNVKKLKTKMPKRMTKKRIDIDMSGGEADVHKNWGLPVFPPF